MAASAARHAPRRKRELTLVPSGRTKLGARDRPVVVAVSLGEDGLRVAPGVWPIDEFLLRDLAVAIVVEDGEMVIAAHPAHGVRRVSPAPSSAAAATWAHAAAGPNALCWASTPGSTEFSLAEPSVAIAVAIPEYLRRISVNVRPSIELFERYALVVVVVECSEILGAAAPRTVITIRGQRCGRPNSGSRRSLRGARGAERMLHAFGSTPLSTRTRTSMPWRTLCVTRQKSSNEARHAASAG